MRNEVDLKRWLVPALAALCSGAIAFGVSFVAVQAAGGPAEEAVANTASASATPFEPTTTWAMSDFPTNSAGLTYGSIAEVNNPADMPDLVAVVGDHGIEGFVLARDMIDPRPTSPGDAVRIQKSQEASRSPLVPVYDLEGAKQVDVFTLYQQGEPQR